MHDWLRSAADALSAETGVARDELELSGEEIDSLLELAAHAAHESGSRLNAPLVCYLLGTARARSDSSIGDLVNLLTTGGGA